MVLKTIQRWAVPSVLSLAALGFSGCTDDDDDDDGDDDTMDAGSPGTDDDGDDDGTTTPDAAAGGDAGEALCGGGDGGVGEVCEGASITLPAGATFPVDGCCADGVCGIQQPSAGCIPRLPAGVPDATCTGVLATVQAGIDAMSDAGAPDGGSPNGLLVELAAGTVALYTGCCTPAGTCGLDANNATWYPDGPNWGEDLNIGCQPLPAEIVDAIGGVTPVCDPTPGDDGDAGTDAGVDAGP